MDMIFCILTRSNRRGEWAKVKIVLRDGIDFRANRATMGFLIVVYEMLRAPFENGVGWLVS